MCRKHSVRIFNFVLKCHCVLVYRSGDFAVASSHAHMRVLAVLYATVEVCVRAGRHWCCCSTSTHSVGAREMSGQDLPASTLNVLLFTAGLLLVVSAQSPHPRNTWGLKRHSHSHKLNTLADRGWQLGMPDTLHSLVYSGGEGSPLSPEGCRALSYVFGCRGPGPHCNGEVTPCPPWA